jgi:hypothetical protein
MKKRIRLMVNQFKNKQNININATDLKRSNNILVKEYNGKPCLIKENDTNHKI